MPHQTAANHTVDSTINRIKQRQARVGIIGLGYVGLPLALLFAEQKFVVTGFDVDARKIDTLAKGGSYIYRISGGRNSVRPGARIFRHRRLFATHSDGRHYHLRAHAAK